jgi:hypothetical protein
MRDWHAQSSPTHAPTSVACASIDLFRAHPNDSFRCNTE